MIRKDFLTGVSIIGLLFTIIEMATYIVFFCHIAYHDNRIAINVLQPSVIQKRNSVNAISMVGLFTTWILEIFYISSVGLLTTLYDIEWLREFSSIFKDVDFVLVPWIQILTTAPIRKYIQQNKNEEAKDQ
jgi:hypothetical protein